MKHTINKLKDGILMGFWILFVIWLAGISYAAFTTFTALETTSWQTLTATKWNDMVDAIHDEYILWESKTNKTWIDGKPIYRKVVKFNIPNSWAWVVLANIADMDVWVHVEAYLEEDNNNTTINTLYSIESQVDMRLYTWQFQMWNRNAGWNGYQSWAIIEYTKTTD